MGALEQAKLQHGEPWSSTPLSSVRSMWPPKVCREKLDDDGGDPMERGNDDLGILK